MKTYFILSFLPLFTFGKNLTSRPASARGPPSGPLVPNAIFKEDLLSSGLQGFNAEDWHPYHVNSELQYYKPENAYMENGKLVIEAERRSDGKIVSARLNTKGKWSTSKSSDIKTRGYIEVRSTFPATARSENSWKYTGAWPAIWLLGNSELNWPHNGEIDIVEAINGKAKIYATTHSTKHHGGNGQHPPKHPFYLNSDFTEYPIVCGLEWNLENHNQIDLTWWYSWFDINSNQWETSHSTLVIVHLHEQDFSEFYKTFNEGGFYLILNLAEGGEMPGVSDSSKLFPDGQPQHMVIESVKTYGF